MRLLKYSTLPLVLMGCFSFSACSKDSAQSFPLTGGSRADDDTGTGGDEAGMGAANMGGQSSAGGAKNEPAMIGGPCASDKECRAVSALCDPNSNACVECLATSD